MLSVEEALNVGNKVALQIAIKNDLILPASLDVLPESMILPPVTSIIDPDFFINALSIRSSSCNELINDLGAAPNSTSISFRAQDVVVLDGVIGFNIPCFIDDEVVSIPLVVVPRKAYFVF